MWNLLWTWSARSGACGRTAELAAREPLAESRQLTRKDPLKRHMQRHCVMFAASRHAAFFECLPTTFDLPREFDAFAAAFGQVGSHASALSLAKVLHSCCITGDRYCTAIEPSL
jgi:hypothetical protein